MISLKTLVSIPLLFCLVCCSSDDSDNTTNADLASMTSILGEIINPTVAVRDTRASACSAMALSECSANLKTRSFSTDGGDSTPCTRGNVSVFGKTILTFSSATCALTTSHTVTRTFDNHYLQLAAGGKVLIYTQTGTVAGKIIAGTDLKDYEGTSRSGGALLTKGSSADTLAITGIHRRSLSSSGRYGYWHTLYSDTDLSISRSGASSTISSGTLILMHNRAKIKVSKEFTDVVFNESCVFPVSGTITYTVTSDSATSKLFTATFSSTCGKASIDGTEATLDPSRHREKVRVDVPGAQGRDHDIRKRTELSNFRVGRHGIASPR